VKLVAMKENILVSSKILLLSITSKDIPESNLMACAYNIFISDSLQNDNLLYRILCWISHACSTTGNVM